MPVISYLWPAILAIALLASKSVANQNGVLAEDDTLLGTWQSMGPNARNGDTLFRDSSSTSNYLNARINTLKSAGSQAEMSKETGLQDNTKHLRSVVRGDVPSIFIVVMVIGYRINSFTREKQKDFLESIGSHIQRKAVTCHLRGIKQMASGDLTVDVYCIYEISRPGDKSKKSFAAILFVPSHDIVQALSSGPMRGFLQKFNVTQYFAEGDPRGVTIAYAVTNEVWFPVAVVASASCLLVFVVICIAFCCRRAICSSPERGHVDKVDHKHERLVFSPVKPMETMSPRMVQPDTGALYTISGSPPKAQKWTASGEIRRGLYQSRRGSQASLVIDLSPVTKSPLTDQGHESPTEETLSRNSRPLDFYELERLKDDEKSLYFEFWSIPSNTASRKDKEFQSSLKNRYPDIIPNKKSIVTLEQIGDDALSTYINANFITGYNYENNMYIATEGPLQSTEDGFWRMIWEYKCPIIVMITKLKEKNEEKCSEYWPTPKTKRQQIYGDLIVTHDSEISRPGYKIATLYINHKDSDTSRAVLHYWFTSWPDHKVPKTCSELLSMAKEVKAARDAVISAGPIVVHCSAGRGRTGCFIAISCGIEQIKAEDSVDVLKIVSNMRIERGGMVQKDSQYIFIHKTLHEFWQEIRLSSPYLQNSQSIEEGEEMKESEASSAEKSHFAW